jgi:hypothetical protein
MRVNVFQTWMGASLVLIAVLMAGTVRTGRLGMHLADGGSILRSSADVRYGAALAAVPTARRPAAPQELSGRRATAMLFVLMAQRGRLGALR